ncbi:kazal-type serine protease inhibitor domain-containing protein 1-like [Salminus brasiliensis]|uniref:kazal-type serine protease inhibitor domain-containing protein 1-like n=1 Tax=Salminus brasiliensis TaxID=930266 RepID=UPI003B82DAAE
MSWAAAWWLGVWVGVWLWPSWAVPPQHRGWLRLWEEGESCEECDRSRCPAAPPGCPAGLVRDRCGCCEHCGNAEGQWCDLNRSQEFYGRCGSGLRCQRRPSHARGRWGDPEPRCVCRSRGVVCGSDGRTYPNLCQLREASSKLETTLYQTALGPCSSVTAYPLPNVGWKKKGSDHFLPGDDPHISVQVRGGPQRYTVSTWLQILGLRQSDAGVFVCTFHNALGETSASAQLSVLNYVVRDVQSGLYDVELFYDRSEELQKEELGSGDKPARHGIKKISVY